MVLQSQRDADRTPWGSPGPGEATARAAGGARRRWSRYSSRTFYLFAAPWLVGFLALTIVPLIYALLVSFTDFDGISPRWHWIGLGNYAELLGDPDTWHSLWQTMVYLVITVPLSLVCGMGLALLLNRRVRGIGFFRTAIYVPAIVPVVASAIIWKSMFDRDTGAINATLQLFGGPTITWLVDPTAFAALIVLVLWGVGGGMIIFLAGLQGVPAELREAAAIDGANPVQAFVAVTLPLLSPVILFQLVTGVIYALQTVVQPLLLRASAGVSTDAGSAAADIPRSNNLYMVNVYQQVFANQRLGYGSALLWVLFVVILALTLAVFRSSALWVYYEVDQGKGG